MQIKKESEYPQYFVILHVAQLFLVSEIFLTTIDT